MAAARWEREKGSERVAMEPRSKPMVWEGCDMKGKDVQMAGMGVQSPGKVFKKWVWPANHSMSIEGLRRIMQLEETYPK